MLVTFHAAVVQRFAESGERSIERRVPTAQVLAVLPQFPVTVRTKPYFWCVYILDLRFAVAHFISSFVLRIASVLDCDGVDDKRMPRRCLTERVVEPSCGTGLC